ncbi:DNA-formamidopyrimidine glycosylase family protein [Aquipuribacter hungaricus]|uniref:DNA-(apurinic or apyrimidinic site) lyase n=1 Tax=Aquipuribacter hungaricus TaxID=545624 RepID=A0ABV7WNA1_9MICO
MPEGDSVWRVARRLEAGLSGRTVLRSDLRVPRSATADLSGQTVLTTVPRGKHLLTRFSGGLTLHTHLRMTGSWTVVGAGKRLPRHLDDTVRVVLATAGPTAYALDMPVVELLRTDREDDVVGHLGPDLLGPGWDPAEAVRRLSRDPARPLAAALLDQRNLAGIGNLWANELCFLRGRSPWTPVGEVDLPPLVDLAHRLLRFSVSGAVTGQNTSQVTTGDPRKGRNHWVSGRAGRPCLRCGTTVRVVEEVPDDPERRRTWWCPRCQPGPQPPADRVESTPAALGPG